MATNKLATDFGDDNRTSRYHSECECWFELKYWLTTGEWSEYYYCWFLDYLRQAENDFLTVITNKTQIINNQILICNKKVLFNFMHFPDQVTFEHLFLASYFNNINWPALHMSITWSHLRLVPYNHAHSSLSHTNNNASHARQLAMDA